MIPTTSTTEHTQNERFCPPYARNKPDAQEILSNTIAPNAHRVNCRSRMTLASSSTSQIDGAASPHGNQFYAA